VNGNLDHARPHIERQIDIAQRQFMLAFKDKGADFGHFFFLGDHRGMA
jgi:hypothetical protein